MFDYMTERSVESKIYPGVKYQIKEVCNEVRDAVVIETAALRSEMQAIVIESAELAEELKAAQSAKEKAELEAKAGDLNLRMDAAVRKGSQIQMRSMLSGIDGMTMNGKPVEVDFFIRRGPEPMLKELGDIIMQMLGLTPEERKNSPSPTTSPELEGGATNDMTVEAAA